MLEIRLKIIVDIEPDETTKFKLRANAEELLREIAPGIELFATQGHGSWWVELAGKAPHFAGWLAAAVGGWVVKRTLDYASNRPSTAPQAGPEPGNVNPHGLIRPAGANDAEGKSHGDELPQSLLEGAGKVLLSAESIHTYRKTTVEISLWSEDESRGAAIVGTSIRGEEVKFRFRSSDSRDDLNQFLRRDS